MITAIQDNVVTPVAVVAHASHKAKPIRVLTNANLGERQQLLDLGFSVQMIDTASVRGLSVDDLDVDFVILDRNLLGVSSIEAMAQFRARGTDVPVVFISGSASLNQPATDKEGLTCGKLVLHNSRGFWNGADLDLSVGEYRIIELLASRPGQYFTFRTIYDRLRNHEGFISGTGPNGYWANLRSAIKRIRNKFRAFDPTFQEIETYTAFGYRWRKPD